MWLYLKYITLTVPRDGQYFALIIHVERVGPMWAWLLHSAVASQRIHTMAARETGKQTISRPVASRKKYEKKINKNSEISWKSRKTHWKGCRSTQGKFYLYWWNGWSDFELKYRGYLNYVREGWAGEKFVLYIHRYLNKLCHIVWFRQSVAVGVKMNGRSHE